VNHHISQFRIVPGVISYSIPLPKYAVMTCSFFLLHQRFLGYLPAKIHYNHSFTKTVTNSMRCSMRESLFLVLASPGSFGQLLLFLPLLVPTGSSVEASPVQWLRRATPTTFAPSMPDSKAFQKPFSKPRKIVFHGPIESLLSSF
jgi:hypothetical protein